MKALRPLYWAISISLAGTTACKTTCPLTPVAPRAAESSRPAPGLEPGKPVPPAASSPLPIALGELAKLATKTDKGPKDHNYVEVYERFMVQWRYEPIKIFEIGIEKGGSLLMWQDYFPKASIFGVDIANMSKMDNARIKTIVGDQSKRDQLQKAIEVSGGDIDILIDDGGHTMEQQQVSLGYLFPFVRPGGYYILEDIHTSIPALWSGYGVEPDGNNSTLRMIQNYMQSEPPKWKSKYMLPEEMKYLDENVEYANLLHRISSRSIMCIFKKRK
jgi:cephalosporin hydroxylase